MCPCTIIQSNRKILQKKGRMNMKEKLHALIDKLSDNETIYAYTFISKMFGKDGAL